MGRSKEVLAIKTKPWYMFLEKTYRQDIDRFVRAGYIVVCQDVRGRYKSDDRWESSRRFVTHEAQDGYDTVDWAARLPGSNGKVGTFGSSYRASLQWRFAPLRPSSLVCMSAHGIPAGHTDLEGSGTIRPGRRLYWWVTTMARDMRRRLGLPGPHTKAEALRLWNGGESKKWLYHLPWLTLGEEAFAHETDAVRYLLRNPHEDPWKLDEGCKRIDVPNLNVIGWRDHCNGDMLLDRTIRSEAQSERARRGSRTIIGPWSHSAKRSYGNIDFGPDALPDLVGLRSAGSTTG